MFSSLTATFDVQRATAGAIGSGQIIVTEEFVTNSPARGCFILLQSEDGSPDVFIALLRPGSDNTTISNIPPSTYSVIFYDLEQNGLPNERPALEPNNTVTVEGTGEGIETSSFMFVSL